MRPILPTEQPLSDSKSESVTLPTLQKIPRFPELDGLRGVAAVGVAIFHYLSGPAEKIPFLEKVLRLLEMTPLSLDTFFILSGFLIGGILLHMRNEPDYYKLFYRGRALRILPLYYLWIAFFSVLFFFAQGWGLAVPTGYSEPFYLASYWLLFQSFYPAIVISATMLIPTWTLVAEEHFYLIIPILVRRLNSRRLLQLLLAAIVVAPLLRAVLFKYFTLHNGWADLSIYFYPPCRADALAMGVILAWLWRAPDLRKWLQTHVSPFRWGMFVFSGIAILLSWMAERNFHHARSLNAGLGRTSIELACFCLIAYLISLPQSAFARLLSKKLPRELGKISYCLYLVHWGVFWMIFRFVFHSRFGEHIWLDFAVAPIGLLISIGIAKFSWKYFEYPLLQRVRGMRPPSPIPAIPDRQSHAVSPSLS
jgi:peptidoglycan/LPS O-acetylase OafA/YrhL